MNSATQTPTVLRPAYSPRDPVLRALLIISAGLFVTFSRMFSRLSSATGSLPFGRNEAVPPPQHGRVDEERPIV